MDTLSYKTVSLNKATVNKEWVVIDATDLPLGRLAARVALVLRGKNKPGFTPFGPLLRLFLQPFPSALLLTVNLLDRSEILLHRPGAKTVF